MVDIKKLIKNKEKIVFGKSEVIRLLREGKLEEVFLAQNLKDIANINNIASFSETKVTVLEHINDELGALCKKPFKISIIGLKKE